MLSEWLDVSPSLYVSCTLSPQGIRRSPVNLIVISELMDVAVAFLSRGMKNGEEREEITFPESLHVDEGRIHMDDSSLSLSEEELIEREPSLQRTFRESDGYPSRPTVFFSNVQSVISTDAPSSIDTGASVELPNVHEVNVPVASVPLNCTREAVHSHIEEESMDEGRDAEKTQFVKIAFPFTAMRLAGVDD